MQGGIGCAGICGYELLDNLVKLDAIQPHPSVLRAVFDFDTSPVEDGRHVAVGWAFIVRVPSESGRLDAEIMGRILPTTGDPVAGRQRVGGVNNAVTA